MSDATLTAQKRSDTGSGVARRLRRDGRVPAVVYGLGEGTVSVSVSGHDLDLILRSASGTNTLITLKGDDGDQLALARQIHRHPVRGTLVHVDFVRVRADQTIEAEVPIQFTGEAEGLREGGVLEQSIFTLTVEALPRDIPNAIEYDITALGIGDSIHVSDLSVPSAVTIVTDPETAVAHISQPRVAEEEAPAAEGEGAEGEAAAEGAGEAPAAEEGSE